MKKVSISLIIIVWKDVVKNLETISFINWLIKVSFSIAKLAAVPCLISALSLSVSIKQPSQTLYFVTRLAEGS